MADRFELDENDAVAAGERAQTAGRRLLDAHRDLVTVLNDREGCWGDDDIGKAFANKYVQVADGTRENTNVLATNFSDAGTYIVDVAGELADVDEGNARRIDGLYADNVESWTAES
ncbi:hypothetical protein [Pseudonocardia sp. MH-G8]|uniref:hypothetical protein n=1 Tax=Pseudonocardia sp. MH-G8 TaxID=1854588 RepID=UPI00117BD093|nr:hypothetical protein [Pseudonocardia sp. MH-G8]